MRALIVPFCLSLTACMSVPDIDENHGASEERLECVRQAGNAVRFRNYKLAFLSRDFTSVIQVWINPDDGRVVVLKNKPGKVCYVSNSLPNTIYMPYDKDTRNMVQTVESK